jgi:cell wall-associated NlpC family hydrolase
MIAMQSVWQEKRRPVISSIDAVHTAIAASDTTSREARPEKEQSFRKVLAEKKEKAAAPAPAAPAPAPPAQTTVEAPRRMLFDTPTDEWMRPTGGPAELPPMGMLRTLPAPQIAVAAPVAPVEPPAAPPQPSAAAPKPAAPAPPPPSLTPAPPAPTTQRQPLEGVGLGDKDSEPNGPISRVQTVLKKWNGQLDLAVNGEYDDKTQRAVLLYKTIYGSGSDGSSIDPQTASHLTAMEDGSFWKNPPSKTAAQKMLYAASRDLGKPYRLGGNGQNATDCAMLTREALIDAGFAGKDFSRLADAQFAYADKGQHGMSRVNEPKAGDLVFFNNKTRQSNVAYRGVTHVGIYLADGQMLAASSTHGKVVVQDMGNLKKHVAGYGRANETLSAR